MKKTYIQPTMKVVEMGSELYLLTTSGELYINSDSNYAVEENAQLSRRHGNIWDDDE